MGQIAKDAVQKIKTFKLGHYLDLGRAKGLILRQRDKLEEQE